MAISIGVAFVGRFFVVVLIMASCGFPRPADVGGDDGTGGAGGAPGSTVCQLTAIEPSIANTDDTIIIEGTFVDPVTANFPGGTSVPATVLGPHRATTTVPALATAGDLTVTACGSTVGPLPFRRPSFATGLGVFESSFDQAGNAQQSVTLTVARDGHTSTVVGHHLYVLGGAGSDGSLNSVEQASINADGSLGPFARVPGVNLVIARQAHTTTVIGNYLYVVGGLGDGSPLNSVERAVIAPDGSLGPFETVADVTLMTARQSHTSAVVGSYLYILGGLGTESLNSVERAIINADGSLGPFMAVSGVTMATARYGHTTAVAGHYIYILGGTHGNNSLQDVERATINADGSLGLFVPFSSGMLVTARSGQTITVVGNYLYVIGGVGSNGALNSVERAPLAEDGSLGTFAAVSGVTLATGRRGHTSAVIGNYLYVLGGGSLNNVERATINASGSLGLFAPVSSATLIATRSGHTTAVIGSYLYVIGGTLMDGSIERATINADGSLGSFATVTGVTLMSFQRDPTIAVIGNYLYVIGGLLGGGTGLTATDIVERATINVDGTLGPFAIVSGVNLSNARYAHTSAVVGNYLYVLGGLSIDSLGHPQFRPEIERATINADGSLGAFSPVSNLMTEREFHTMAVVGNYLYLVGGLGTSPEQRVERATINADGSLGTFATISGVTLVADRYAHTSTVIGNYLYLLGGVISAPGQDVERATINADGSLGTFVTVPGLLADRLGLTTAVIGNYLYVLGDETNSIDQATLSVDAP